MDWRGLLDGFGIFFPFLVWASLVALIWLRTGRTDRQFATRLSEVDSRFDDPDDLRHWPNLPPDSLQQSFLFLGAVIHRQADPTLERLRQPVRRDLALRAGVVLFGWIPAMAAEVLLRTLL